MKKRVKRPAHISYSTKLPYSVHLRTIYISLGVIIAVIFFGKILSPVQSTSQDVQGQSTLLARGDDSDSGSSGSGSSGSSSNRNELDDEDDNSTSGIGSGSSGSNETSDDTPRRSATPGKLRTKSDGTRVETEIEEDETRTEVKLSESERIRVRTEDGRTRVDITSGGIKTRLENRDDRVIVKVEQEDGTETELEDSEGTFLKIEERLNDDGIKVSTGSGERFILTRGNTGAVTQFPLSVDLATNTLFLNTPSGQQSVRVLPDRAIQNLIAANVVSRIRDSLLAESIKTGNLAALAEIIVLGEQNGIPVYEINGISDQKLLGFIPVEIEKKVTVSAETGEVVKVNQSSLNSLVDFISL
ncbi:MAG: hypothetical protein AAB874_04690 [Patescibacteria group bacterium]